MVLSGEDVEKVKEGAEEGRDEGGDGGGGRGGSKSIGVLCLEVCKFGRK